MIEIVFGESACGSLKIAQTYGKGKYRGSAVSIFMRHEDGSVPSSDEMKKAQLQAQEQERIAWENAIPLGGKSSDVYCFDMVLSVGDISDNGIGEQRKNIFKKMHHKTTSAIIKYFKCCCNFSGTIFPFFKKAKIESRALSTSS